jgi:mono/diheme cytochrome c family protein
MRFKRFVNVLEIVVLLTALAFVVALFVNEPGGGSGASMSPGEAIFSANCAACHGADGQGGTGPRLAGRVVKDFPDAADQIAFVRDGRDGMPSFGGGRLGEREIAQVVDYTRTKLGS